ncbi:uncharacterized protein [Amphiura filiformis]|uniref:uncharacterized protein n=1 Tax=Amphiura filiformis TaxID=82378 RepID=UPI003B212CD5
MASSATMTFFYGLLTLLIMQTLHQQTDAQLTWKMDPKDIIALQGDTVMVNCIISGRNTTQGEQKFWWYKPDRGQYISRNYALYVQEPHVSRFTVLLDKHLGVYSLVIRNVTEYDGGQYQCIFRQTEEQESFSGLTTVTVLIPPAEGYPKCTTYPKSHLLLSPLETEALHCPRPPPETTHARSNITVYHVWTHQKELVHAFFLQNKTTLFSQAKPKGTPESKAPVAYCTLDDPALLGPYPERCRLLATPQKASARISPGTVTARLGESVNYTCHSEDIAVVTDYSWQFSKPVPSVGLSVYENGQVISIQKFSRVEDLVKITCTVKTEWGLIAEASADLTTVPSVLNFVDNSTTTTPVDANDNSSSIYQSDETKIATIIPEEKNTIRNIGFLIGPGIGVLLLFIGAIFLACCIIKWKTKGKKLRRGTFKTNDAPVTLRTVAKNQNRNSSALSRRFSDSYRYDGNHGVGNYENFQAITAHQNSAFLRGVSSFQGQNGGPNSPLEANVKVHIEMPNLSASLPALNMYKVSGNGGKDPPPPPPDDEDLQALNNFPPPLPLLETPVSTLNRGNSYQDLYVDPQPDTYNRPDTFNTSSPHYHHDHHHHHHHHSPSISSNGYGGNGVNGYHTHDEPVNYSYHNHDHNELQNNDRPRKIPPPVFPRRKTPSISNDWNNGRSFSNTMQPLHRI